MKLHSTKNTFAIKKNQEDDFAIQAQNLTLHVPVFMQEDKQLISTSLNILKGLYLGNSQRKIVTILDNLNFSLKNGDRLGLIGSNGAGKSTLLRLLAGIYHPSHGDLKVEGRVQGLFDISLGMNPEATGMENIFVRGLQMGLRLKEIEGLLDNILSFAELGQAINKPLHTYSSGMRVRLAFAISTMIEPEVLLLDEWIGVGDANFRKKFEMRMNELVDSCRALVLATHNNSLMSSLCTHGMVLNQGKIVFFGQINEALSFYNKA